MAKHIRFDRTVKVYSVLSLSDMTPQEIDSIFLNSKDQIRINSGIRKDVRAMRRRAPAEKEKVQDDESGKEPLVCFRGLEHLRSSAHLEQHKINRECNIHAVLSEQHRQQRASSSAGEDATEDIAEASRRTSEWARNYAARAGASDAAYVRSTINTMACIRRRCPEVATSAASKASSAFPHPRSEALVRALNIVNDEDKKRHLKQVAAAVIVDEEMRVREQRHSLAGTNVNSAADRTIHHLPRRLSGDPAVGPFARPLGRRAQETGTKTRRARVLLRSRRVPRQATVTTMLPPL